MQTNVGEAGTVRIARYLDSTRSSDMAGYLLLQSHTIFELGYGGRVLVGVTPLPEGGAGSNADQNTNPSRTQHQHEDTRTQQYEAPGRGAIY